jgi:hypothetical protein
VERANGSIKEGIASLVAQKRDEGEEETSWVTVYPDVMAAVNQISNGRTNNDPPYDIVFGMSYHEPLLMASMKELAPLQTVAERVDKLGKDLENKMRALGEYGSEMEDEDDYSPNQKAAAQEYYVTEHPQSLASDMEGESKKLDVAATLKQRAIDAIAGAGGTNLEAAVVQKIVKSSSIQETVKSTGIAGIKEKVKSTGIQKSTGVQRMVKSTGIEKMVKSEKPTVSSKNPVTDLSVLLRKQLTQVSIEDAFKRAAGNKRILDDDHEVGCVYPRLTCQCTNGQEILISAFQDEYCRLNYATNRWWERDFVETFAMLLQHDMHPASILFRHCCPSEEVTQEMTEDVPDGVSTIAMLAWSADHYLVLQFDLSQRRVLVFEGLGYGLTSWLPHCNNILKRMRLVPSNARRPCKLIPKKGLPSDGWHLVRGDSPRQPDAFSCSPRAAVKLWSMFDKNFDLSKLSPQEYSKAVVVKYQALLSTHDDVLKVRRRADVFTILEDGNIVQESKRDGKKGDYDPFACPICLDTVMLDSERNVLTCAHSCHLHCILQWHYNSVNGTFCPLCRMEIPNMVVEQATSEEDAANQMRKECNDKESMSAEDMHSPSLLTSNAFLSPADSTLEASSVNLCRLKRQESEEKRRRKRQKQAKKMTDMYQQSVNVKVGSIVSLKVDRRDQSHANPLGLLGVMFNVGHTHEHMVQVVTEHGVLSPQKDKLESGFREINTRFVTTMCHCQPGRRNTRREYWKEISTQSLSQKGP